MSKLLHSKFFISLNGLALLFGLMLHSASYSQVNNIDSLLREFKYNPGIDLRTYDQLFMALYPEYMEELILVAEDLLKRSVHEGNQNGMHRAADAFGLYFASKGHFNQAYKVLHRSMRFYERTENQGYLMKAYHYLGTLFLNWGNLDEAISHYQKLIKIANESPDAQAIYMGRNNLALTLFEKKRYDLGIELLKENLNSQNYMNDEGLATMRNLLGNYYLNLGKIDSAKYHYSLSIQHAKKNSASRLISTAYANLAICEFYLGSDKSLILFETSLDYAFKSQSTERICVSLFNLASYYLELDDKIKSIELFNQSFDIASKNNSYRNMFDALDEIAEIYREQGNWHKVDSVNALIREIKSQQYQDFLNLAEDTELLESVFVNEVSGKNEKVLNSNDVQFLNRTILFSLLFFIVIQFVLILFMSNLLIRKRSKTL